MVRIVCTHSRPGDVLLDPFAGSGTLGEAAGKNNRDVILIDNNATALQVMSRRFAAVGPIWHNFKPGVLPPAADSRSGEGPVTP